MMLMPRPVPSMARFLFSSIRLYGEKRFSISSSFMPIPVSRTVKQRLICDSSVFSAKTDRFTSPVSVYFTALVSRFITHCLIRISSPTSRCGICRSTLTLNFKPFFSARLLITFTRSLIREDRSYCTGMISILPSSTFERSRMSLISESKVFPADMISAAYARIPFSFDSRRIISSIPITALMGVRISWDILARKRLFASFARSAISRCF